MVRFLTGADRMEWGKGGKGRITSAHPLGVIPYLAPARFLGQSPSRARGLNAASGHPPNCVFHVTDLVSKSHQSTKLMTSACCKRFSSPYCPTWPWVKHVKIYGTILWMMSPYYSLARTQNSDTFLGSDMEAVVHGKGDTGPSYLRTAASLNSTPPCIAQSFFFLQKPLTPEEETRNTTY